MADSQTSTIRKLTQSGTNWIVTTIGGNFYNNGDTDGTNNISLFYYPASVAVDSARNVYVADWDNQTIRKIAPVGTNWITSTLAGNTGVYGSADGIGTNALFDDPVSVALDSMGDIYVADSVNNEIREITSAGIVSTLAGVVGSRGNANGNGGAARFNEPRGVTVDKSGNVFVADTYNDTIRKVTSAGLVSTVAGLATNTGSADGVGSNARFNSPTAVAWDGSGNLYVADASNNIIRKITSAGVVSTIAGLAGSQGANNGTNNVARFNLPSGIAMDNNGNLYVTDTRNSTIRKITPVGTNWVVTTIAGLAGSSGRADGTNSAARFDYPEGITVDDTTNLYVADYENFTIRKIAPVGTNWIVTSINIPGSSQPSDVAINAGNLYVVDSTFSSSAVREYIPVGTNWAINIIGGSTADWGSADGAGSAALFNGPQGITVDSAGAVYVADSGNNTIRKGVFTAFASANTLVSGVSGTNGALEVTLVPPEAGGQWRFGWETGWRASGSTVGNLVAGNYPVEFRSVPGYLTVQTNFTAVVTANQTAYVTNQYYPTLNDGSAGVVGTLTVNLTPGVLGGTGWRFLGGTGWRAAGSTATNLLPGVYDIEFEPVSGYSKPSSEELQVYAGFPTVISAGYLLAANAPPNVLLPFAVPGNEIGDVADYPFGFNGQLQSDIGYGSGVAVQTNVVLTAAHLVFNDQTLNYVSQVFWYFQQEAGVSALQPQAARGWYVLSGYAAQRTNDIFGGLTPDQSSPQSRNFDVAALYFPAPVAGGGYGGYLPSDESPNPWLTGNSLKMLVGYPVDGSMFGDASIIPGEMYQTDPQPYPLALAGDAVTNQQEVYTANWFLSYPGNSGGPVYAQFNGYYYPAEVYLGTLYSGVTPYASAVRAIDSAVVNLITNAAALGDSGTNHTGGGVITIIPSQAVSASNPGYLQFQLMPPAAVAAGAGWRLQGDSSYSSATNYIRAVFSTNAFAVEFKPVNGWNLPANQAVSVPAGQITSYNADYIVTNPVLVANTLGIGITGTTNTVYRIESRTNLATGLWLPVSTNTITTDGFNLLLPKPATNAPTMFYRAVWLQ